MIGKSKGSSFVSDTQSIVKLTGIMFHIDENLKKNSHWGRQCFIPSQKSAWHYDQLDNEKWCFIHIFHRDTPNFDDMNLEDTPKTHATTWFSDPYTGM